MKSGILIGLFLLANITIAQTERSRWEAKSSIFQLPQIEERDYSLDKSNFGMLTLTAVRNLYWFAFSDLDGDNCPFHPSCSAFFVQAVKQTNFVQGLLMFADRFTRDTNFFKSREQYKIDETGKLYDPVEKYTLSGEDIKTIPSGKSLIKRSVN